MQAMIRERYGAPDVLRFNKVEKPQPGDDELLVRVEAASVNPYDWHQLRGTPFIVRMQFGWRRPKRPIVGVDLAGVVEAVGKNVTEFQSGDAVFGASGYGAFAEYSCVAEKRLVHKPANVTFAEAAAVPMAALTALQAVRDHGDLQQGQHVLIIGAGGGVGSFALQIAKTMGAIVTAVCSTEKVPLVQTLGADHIVDYTKEDILKTSAKFDLIVDTAAYRSYLPYRQILTGNGRYVMVGGALWRTLAMLAFGKWMAKESQQFKPMLAKTTKADLETLREMLTNQQLKPLLGKRYPLRQVPEALSYVEAGHATGKVIIDIGNG